jgi:hypothetical protein
MTLFTPFSAEKDGQFSCHRPFKDNGVEKVDPCSGK